MSTIHTDVPASPIALTKDVRDNFARAKADIEKLEAFINSQKASDSPNFTGTATIASALVNGTLTIANVLDLSAMQTLTLKTGNITPYANVTVNSSALYRIGPLVVLQFFLTLTNAVASQFFNVPAGFRPLVTGNLQFPVASAGTSLFKMGYFGGATVGDFLINGGALNGDVLAATILYKGA